MGLDAVVFRNIRNLEALCGQGHFEVDETTGEGLLKQYSKLRIPRDCFFAVEKRLGNVAEIASLRELIGTALDPGDSLILSRVVCSGSHSGDSIKLDDLPQLRDEVRLLKSQGMPGLHGFLESLDALLEAAEAEQNPIVFV